MSTSARRVGAPTPRLLSAILDVNDGSPFVVLRNAEELPAALSGRDLDVALVPGVSLRDATRFLLERAEALGWQGACLSTRAHMTGVTFLHEDREVAGIHVDVFDDVRWLGVPLITSEHLAEESIVIDDVRRLAPRMETLVTVVHRILHGGNLNKAKYVEQLRAQLMGQDHEWFSQRVCQLLGSGMGAELTDLASIDGLQRQGSRRQVRAWMAALVGSLLRRPWATLSGLGGYVTGQCGSSVRPPGVVGEKGDQYPGLPGQTLTLELACTISVYAFEVPHVRSPAAQLRTLNATRYLDMLRRRWRFWTPLRWFLPSAFLWLQAKRAGVVVVHRLPLGLSVLRWLNIGPNWVAIPCPGIVAPK